MTYALNQKDVFIETFGDEMVLLNVATGIYIRASGAAKQFVETVQAGYSVDSVVKAYKDGEDGRGDDAYGFFYRLAELAFFVQPDGSDASFAGGAPEADKTGASFDFECFDDLSDLLVADPVHDLDFETGRLAAN